MIVVPGGPGEGTEKPFFLPLFLLLGQAALPVHPGDGGVGGGIGVSVSHGAFLLVEMGLWNFSLSHPFEGTKERSPF